MKHKQNYQQLILRIRNDDQQAFSQLLADYEPLIASEIARYAAGIGSQDQEDLRQVALLALYRAAMAYDLEQTDVEFGLYAKICISNALVSQLRIIRRSRSELLDTQAPDTLYEDPAKLLLEREAAEALQAHIRARLSPYEYRVWNLYVAGLSARDIADAVGREPHSVENAVYRIRQKLRKSLGRNGGRD